MRQSSLPLMGLVSLHALPGADWGSVHSERSSVAAGRFEPLLKPQKRCWTGNAIEQGRSQSALSAPKVRMPHVKRCRAAPSATTAPRSSAAPASTPRSRRREPPRAGQGAGPTGRPRRRARPPEVDADAVAAGLAKTLLAVALRVTRTGRNYVRPRAAGAAAAPGGAARLASDAPSSTLRSAIQAPSARASLRATALGDGAALFEAFPIVEISPRPKRRSAGVATICGLPLPSDSGAGAAAARSGAARSRPWRASSPARTSWAWRCRTAGVGGSAPRVADGGRRGGPALRADAGRAGLRDGAGLVAQRRHAALRRGRRRAGRRRPGGSPLPNLLALRAVARRRAAGRPGAPARRRRRSRTPPCRAVVAPRRAASSAEDCGRRRPGRRSLRPIAGIPCLKTNAELTCAADLAQRVARVVDVADRRGSTRHRPRCLICFA